MKKYPFEYNDAVSDLLDHKIEALRNAMVREIVRHVNNGKTVRLLNGGEVVGYCGPNWDGVRKKL